MMNLFFRLLLALFLSARYPRITLEGAAHLYFRTYWFDCDLNGHLTNSKYLAFMDLGRVGFLQQLGVLKNFFYQRRWFPILQSVDLTFVKEICPGDLIELKTQLLGADEKYIYLEQKFFVRGVLCCVGRVRGLFVSPKGKVSIQDLSQALNGPLPSLPTSIHQWKSYLAEKKHETS